MRGITIFLLFISFTSLQSQPITLRDTTNQFDYIIITVPEFVNASEPFRHHKETVRDFRTLIVDTTQIFAEFDSSAAPQDNIRNFISYAGTFWQQPRPKFFLIVGDVETVPNFLILFPPSAYYNSDFYYSNSIYNSDSTETDFYIGRIPAQNTSEIENYFSKVIEYENINTLQSWMNNNLFICEDDFIYGFFNAAFQISENLPSYMRSYFITDADTSAYYGNLDSIYNAIENRGCATVWFEGFVSDSGFALPNWFYLEDLNNLANQPKYFLTVFLGHQFSIMDSITNFTDQLMFLQNAGSIGGVVFTSYVYMSVDISFQKYWANRLYDPLIESLGQAVLDSLPLPGSIYWYVRQITNLWTDPSLKLKYDETVDVEEVAEIIPGDYVLFANYPNPFNPSTTISWQSATNSRQTLKIYDVLGNEIVTLVDEYKPAGRYEVEFNAEGLPSGTYFYKLITGSFSQTKKMILLK